jgi:cytochrome c-type biogenesis protein CcmH
LTQIKAPRPAADGRCGGGLYRYVPASGQRLLREEELRLGILITALLLAAQSAGLAVAVEPDEMLQDPVLEQRARDISQNLRCLVCQNQSIDDSNADLARNLRIIVRERLVAGDSDEAVLQYVVDRYGDYVLLRPPLKPTTYALWYGPLAILLIGVAGLAVALKRRRAAPDAPALTATEQARIRELLAGDPDAR